MFGPVSDIANEAMCMWGFKNQNRVIQAHVWVIQIIENDDEESKYWYTSITRLIIQSSTATIIRILYIWVY